MPKTMKRLLFLLVLLFPGYLFAQRDSVQLLENEVVVDEFQAASPAPLTWRDRREPILAGFLSYMMPGLGQLYNKDYEKAFGIAAFMACSMVMSYRFAKVGDEATSSALIGIGMSGAWLYSFFDAIATAKKINRSIELQLSKNTSLSLKPDLELYQKPMAFGNSKVEPTLGLKLSVSL
jgi:hypothetical protein